MVRRPSNRPSAGRSRGDGDAGADPVAEGARRLSELAASANSPSEIYDAAAAELLRLPDVLEVHVQRLSAATPETGFAVAYHGDAPSPQRVYTAALDASSAVESALRSPGAVVLADARDLPVDVAAALPEEAPALLLRVGPLDAARALITVVGSPSQLFADPVVHAAETLAAVTAAAIAAVERRLESSTDPRTGALNESAVAIRLDEEINRARRQGTRLACLLVALDDLPTIAQRYGSAATERILGHVGAVLRREFRRFDRVAYLGRGEFIVVLPGAGGAQCEVVARRTLRRLHAIKLEEQGARRPLRASIGLGEWREPHGPWELVASARAAMLRAGQREADGQPPETLSAARG